MIHVSLALRSRLRSLTKTSCSGERVQYEMLFKEKQSPWFANKVVVANHQESIAKSQVDKVVDDQGDASKNFSHSIHSNDIGGNEKITSSPSNASQDHLYTNLESLPSTDNSNRLEVWNTYLEGLTIVNTAEVSVVPDSLKSFCNKELNEGSVVNEDSIKKDEYFKQWEMRNNSLDLSKESPLNPLENKESSSVINSRGEEVSNSQGSLCKNFHELRMGVSRGRPKKKHRIGNNPFDFKLNSRLRGKSQNKRASKVKQRLRDFNSKVSDDMRVNSSSK